MPEGKEITLLAELTFAAPVGEIVLGELEKLVSAVRLEPGCIAYAAHTQATDPRRVAFYERWESQAALDAHMAAPALTAFLAVIGPRLAGAPELTFLTRLG
jgi:quinol monooxygenase YgiN